MMENKNFKLVRLWVRSFFIVFFSSFAGIAFCIALLVAAGMFEDIGWRVLSLNFMSKIMEAWLQDFAIKQLSVCLFIAILVSTKYVLDANAK